MDVFDIICHLGIDTRREKEGKHKIYLHKYKIVKGTTKNATTVIFHIYELHTKLQLSCILAG